MTQVFLIRHGEVEGNSGARRTYVGWADKPLTVRGEAQAAALAERLKREKLRAVYSSDLQRARCTAERIALEHRLKVRSDAAFRESSYGAWEGLSQEEILAQWSEAWQRRQADPVQCAPPNGENLADLWTRWQPAWQRIVKAHNGEAVALVAHNTALRMLLYHLLGAPLTNYRCINLSNGGLSLVEVDVTHEGSAPQVRVHYINDTCHLNDI